MDIEGWNERYRAQTDDSEVPTPLLVETASRLAPGRALDLACGTGRNAIWLAGHGWDVTAIDGSPVAIDRLRRRCPSVDAQVTDLERHELEMGLSAWNLVVVCCYLQRDLFGPVKRAVKPGGVVLVIVHLVDPGRKASRFSVEPGELRAYFEGWPILHDREGASSDPEHRRAVAEIVARRPS